MKIITTPILMTVYHKNIETLMTHLTILLRLLQTNVKRIKKVFSIASDCSSVNINNLVLQITMFFLNVSPSFHPSRETQNQSKIYANQTPNMSKHAYLSVPSYCAFSSPLSSRILYNFACDRVVRRTDCYYTRFKQ